ncbi:MAG: DNA/RNA non-specific endonuclease [Legionellales bacterium]|nr:DNA/RNA non-specific endonuclease [Legionellales bacterium]
MKIVTILKNMLLVLILIIISIFFSTTKLNNQEETSSKEYANCFIKCPAKNNSNNIIIDHGIITLSYNIETKFSDWVAYRVNKNNLHGKTKQRNWQQDPMLPEEYALHPKDFYRLSSPPLHCDRGHQAPLASFSNNPNWYKTNYVSNITPQKSKLNRGIWAKLESKVRKLATSYETIFVLTGPYYEKQYKLQLPYASKPHKIPAGYWKIIINNTTNPIRVSAFLFPQEPINNDTYCHYLTNISNITTKTDLQFFDYQSLEYEPLDNELGC